MRTIRKALITAPLVAAAVLVPASVAYAAEPDIVSADAVVRLDPLLLSFLIGSFVPLLVSLVAKLRASSPVKSVLNLVLSIGAGVLAAYAADTDSALTLLEIATAAIAAYTASGVTYSHLWKPTGVTNAIAVAVPGGIGTDQVKPRGHGEPEVRG